MMTKWWYLIYLLSWLRGSQELGALVPPKTHESMISPHQYYGMEDPQLPDWIMYILYTYIPGCPGESLNWLLNRYHSPTTPSRNCWNWEYCWLWDAAHAWDAGEKPKETLTPAFSFSGSFLRLAKTKFSCRCAHVCMSIWGPGLTFHLLTSNPSPTSHNCGHASAKSKQPLSGVNGQRKKRNITQQGCCIHDILYKYKLDINRYI